MACEEGDCHKSNFIIDILSSCSSTSKEGGRCMIYLLFLGGGGGEGSIKTYDNKIVV